MKIVLFGDSIRLNPTGYGLYVEEELRKEGYDVFQPDDNCRFAKYTLRLIWDYKEEIKDADIIHFNIGHWDLCTIHDDGLPFSSIEEYTDNLRRIAKLFLRITPHVIFATTTPVRKEYAYQNNEVIQKYNEAAIQVMNELGIRVNDLYHVISNEVNKYISDDLIHPNEEGKRILAKQVLKVIKEEIKTA